MSIKPYKGVLSIEGEIIIKGIATNVDVKANTVKITIEGKL